MLTADFNLFTYFWVVFVFIIYVKWLSVDPDGIKNPETQNTEKG